jgi:hypothetical protein
MAKLRPFTAKDLEHLPIEITTKEQIQSFLQSLYGNKDYIKYLHSKIDEYRYIILDKYTEETDRIYNIGKLDAINELLKDIDWAIKKSLTIKK